MNTGDVLQLTAVRPLVAMGVLCRGSTGQRQRDDQGEYVFHPVFPRLETIIEPGRHEGTAGVSYSAAARNST